MKQSLVFDIFFIKKRDQQGPLTLFFIVFGVVENFTPNSRIAYRITLTDPDPDPIQSLIFSIFKHLEIWRAQKVR